MAEINVRYGSKSEIDEAKFQLFSQDNDGETIVVAENEAGEIVGFAQLEGDEIGFMESNEKGAGRAMVEFLKDDIGYLKAVRTDDVSKGFWEKMGFKPCGFRTYEFSF